MQREFYWLRYTANKVAVSVSLLCKDWDERYKLRSCQKSASLLPLEAVWGKTNSFQLRTNDCNVSLLFKLKPGIAVLFIYTFTLQGEVSCRLIGSGFMIYALWWSLNELIARLAASLIYSETAAQECMRARRLTRCKVFPYITPFVCPQPHLSWPRGLRMSRQPSTTRWRGNAKPMPSPNPRTAGWRTGSPWTTWRYGAGCYVPCCFLIMKSNDWKTQQI